MCGCENQFSRSELVHVDAGAGREELDTLVRGMCRDCGEPIDLTGWTGALRHSERNREGGRFEAVVAFALLALLLVMFVIGMIAGIWLP